MSFGFSVSDITMFLKGFYHIIDILKAEAVDKWKTYNLTYSRLYQFTQILKRIQVNDPDSRVLLSHIQRETATTLKEFFIKIRGFEKYLGPSRDRRSFLGAIQKIRWSMRLPKLDELCTKLESQVAHANFCLVAQGK
ncbi:hypothetical protein F9C07_1092812 [Aspergillus flavus]|uniref:Uncharacterized protein n=1 Tax=Aspergillus flavus (strain ATCC 200026 / FGSC A1120 / IAM 13836 / NRRL 3357 / JCM 12722 / SRRC 167) TaxID=332952 RepID=A0A7U2MR27_ASPFN|nr:hypothetical protein F9C07_1092812 [Aspergillus flavus]